MIYTLELENREIFPFLKKIIIFCALFGFLFAPAKEIHPYHVGSVEINYNTASKTFEISAKFFLDDLETVLNKKYGKNIHFSDEKYKSEINTELKNYFADYFKLKNNNKFLIVNYVGYEEDKESVLIYLESEATETPKKVETAVSLLYDLYNDQMNLVHIIVNGDRKSAKLNYPDRYLYQIF